MSSIECSFCRARKLKSVGHSAKFCPVLREHTCERCGEKGHGPSRCQMSLEEFHAKQELVRRRRWEENQRVKKEEQSKKELELVSFKANSWAAKVGVKILPAAAAKMAEDDKKIQAAKTQEQHEKNEKKMRRTYGIESGLRIPHGNIYCQEQMVTAGDFWYFFIENTTDDSEYAKQLRDEETNRERFHGYLQEKHGRNWLIRAVDDGNDWCVYLDNMRQLQINREEAVYWDILEHDKSLNNKSDYELDPHDDLDPDDDYGYFQDQIQSLEAEQKRDKANAEWDAAWKARNNSK